ncbi:MAG: hypothetical protein WCG23_06255 [bacterium]
MAIGPQDYIDQMLAKKYSAEKVNNISEDVSRLAISKERYWEIQKDIAEVQRALVMVNTKFQVGRIMAKAASLT